MKLVDLEPQFLRIVDENGSPDFSSGGRHWKHVDAIPEADGVLFLCPLCWQRNAGPIGTHSVICWRPHVPQTISPMPGRWQFEGGGYGDLSLVAGSSSVLLMDGCKAHFFVSSGEIILT